LAAVQLTGRLSLARFSWRSVADCTRRRSAGCRRSRSLVEPLPDHTGWGNIASANTLGPANGLERSSWAGCLD